MSRRNLSVRLGVAVGLWAASDAWSLPPWTITDIREGCVVAGSSIAVLPTGHPAIAYHDATNRDLRYAWFDGAVWHDELVDDAPGWIGEYNSLAILPSGNPGISYFAYREEPQPNEVRYAEFDGTAWQIDVLAPRIGFSLPGSPSGTSLCTLPNGDPCVAFCASVPSDTILVYAWRDNFGWHCTGLEGAISGSRGPSLEILPTGDPLMVYLHRPHGGAFDKLRFARTRDGNWEFAPMPSNALFSGNPTNLVRLPSGHCAAVYPEAGPIWQYAVYDGEGWTLTPFTFAGPWYSLAVESNGRPLLAGGYVNGPEALLRYAWKAGDTWRGVSIEYDYGSPLDVFGGADIAVLPDGRRAIAYGANIVEPARNVLRIATAYGFGDLYCDGAENVLDINPFVLAITDATAYAAAYPGCNRLYADVNADGLVNVLDINAFVELLLGE